MNKVALLALASIALVPALAFARGGDDWSWGESHSKDTGKGGGRSFSTGSTGTGTPPMMASGARLEMAALHMAMAKLTPEQHNELMKLIREFLTTKGVAIPTPSEMKDDRKEVKEVKKEARDEIKDLKKTNRDAIKAKREMMKGKVKDLRRGSGTTLPPPAGTGSVQ